MAGGVDAATGAQYKLYPTTIHVDFEPVQGVDLSPEDRLKRLDELYAQGKITKEEYEAIRRVIAKCL